MDMNENQVTIKGVLDPQAVCNKIKKKTKRMAKVLSPLPAAEGEPLPPIITSQVSGGLTTVELNVNMHCQACADQLKKKILKMRGTYTFLDLVKTKILLLNVKFRILLRIGKSRKYSGYIDKWYFFVFLFFFS